jgi:Zn finger protein HypA/HybF involved in hydrogenase expression
MLKTLIRYAMFIFDPPWEKEGPDNFTLAVPEAHSTFKRGDVGWPNRPPAVVRCSRCSTTFTHELANDVIDCPDCQRQHPPDEFAEMDLVGLVCPHCRGQLDHGIRHPEMLDVPEWASCTSCQYHWEYQHDYEQ